MSRRRFDHLFVEASVAVGARLPRYALWQRVHASGWDPESLTAEAAAAFCGEPLAEFLAERGHALTPRAKRRLLRSVERYDPEVPTPEELLFGAS